MSDTPEATTEDSVIYPYLVLRCGGKGGQCARPVFVPTNMLGDIEKVRAMHQQVGWGMIEQKAGNMDVLDLACPECLMRYIAAMMDKTNPPVQPDADEEGDDNSDEIDDDDDSDEIDDDSDEIDDDEIDDDESDEE